MQLIEGAGRELHPPVPSPQLPGLQVPRTGQHASSNLFNTAFSPASRNSRIDDIDRQHPNGVPDKRYTTLVDRSLPYSPGGSSAYPTPAPSQHSTLPGQQPLPPMQDRPTAAALPAAAHTGFSSAQLPSGIAPTSYGESRYYTSEKPGESRRPSYNYETASRHDSRATPYESYDSSRAYQYPGSYEYLPQPYQFQQMPMNDATYQRKRRGNLPKEATGILKDWFNNHRESPYPSEEEKQTLCERTGLTLNQVSLTRAASTL